MKHLVLLLTLLAAPALAQTTPAADTPATTANHNAMERMTAGMDTPATGDADRDFVAGMLPHHQGAIDMAEAETRYGHDPALKQLAHDIIVAQNKEIVFMRRWQLQHPVKPAP